MKIAVVAANGRAAQKVIKEALDRGFEVKAFGRDDENKTVAKDYVQKDILDEDLEVDLETEYLPEAGRKLGGLVDDHGISRIARDLTAAEQEIKDELEGKAVEEAEAVDKENAAKTFQVVSGNMFSRARDPVLCITPNTISFNKTCVDKLHKVTHIELLFNPVERIIIVRPCSPDHPNAIVWDSKYKSAGPLSKVIYNSMGWETDYTFRIPCQVLRNPNMSPSTGTVLAFDLDNYMKSC